MRKPDQFVQQHAQALSSLLDAAARLRELHQEYYAVGMDAALTDDHTAQLGLTKAQFVDSVAAASSIEAAIQVNKTNLYRGAP